MKKKPEIKEWYETIIHHLPSDKRWISKGQKTKKEFVEECNLVLKAARGKITIRSGTTYFPKEVLKNCVISITKLDG